MVDFRSTDGLLILSVRTNGGPDRVVTVILFL